MGIRPFLSSPPQSAQMSDRIHTYEKALQADNAWNLTDFGGNLPSPIFFFNLTDLLSAHCVQGLREGPSLPFPLLMFSPSGIFFLGLSPLWSQCLTWWILFSLPQKWPRISIGNLQRSKQLSCLPLLSLSLFPVLVAVVTCSGNSTFEPYGGTECPALRMQADLHVLKLPWST